MTQIFERHYRIVDLAVRISTPSQAIADIMGHLLGGFAASPTQPSPLHIIASACPDERIDLQLNSDPIQTFESLDAFASDLEWQLICQATETMPYLGLHAGAIAFGDRAILFPGASGRGKTTLTLGCLIKGAHLLSDEIAPIHPESSCALPFPRVLCIKKTGLDFLSTLALPAHAVRRIGTTACISPCAFSRTPIDTPVPVKTIAFPQYRPDVTTALKPISRAQALTRLLEQTMNRYRHAHTCLPILGRMVENAACYEFSMRNCDEAMAHLMREQS